MLYITRKIGETIIINNNIEVKVVEVQGKSVKLGFVFPPEASILRKELHDKIKAENLAASKAQTNNDLNLLQEILDNENPSE